MNEEEKKKSIEIFKSFVELGNTTNADNIKITIDLAKIIMGYIKTLEKENKNLRIEFEKVYEDNLTLAHELKQEKEKNKENIECIEEWINGERVSINCIHKDKIKAIQGQLCMQLGSYVRNEASPEQERIAGGIKIINKILKGE